LVKNKLSIGVCIGPDTDRRTITGCLFSIVYRMNKDNPVEVITIGQSELILDIVQTLPELWSLLPHMKRLDFDESLKKGWITRKKNLMVQAATHENILLIHDYYRLSPTFLSVFENVEQDFDILQPRIITKEGARHSDWIVDPKWLHGIMTREIAQKHMEIAPTENHPVYVCGVPYNNTDLNHLLYVSGGLILAKKKVLLDVPLPETHCWGDAEDLEWSKNLHKSRKSFKMNRNLLATCGKESKWQVFEMPESTIQKLKEVFGKIT